MDEAVYCYRYRRQGKLIRADSTRATLRGHERLSNSKTSHTLPILTLFSEMVFIRNFYKKSIKKSAIHIAYTIIFVIYCIVCIRGKLNYCILHFSVDKAS